MKNQTGVMLNLFQHLFHFKQQQTLKSVQGDSHRTNGFTLIELLVVVLIIGILAAIALPQYQLAVQKTRYTAVMPVVKTFADALERSYLANGSYLQHFDKLDIDLPGGYTVRADASIADGPDGVTIDLLEQIEDTHITAYVPQVGVFRQWLDHSPSPRQRECWGNHRLCKSLGGVLLSGDKYILP